MRLLLLALLLLPAVLASAQTSSLELLKVGVNAEAGSMGDAHVATADDAYAPFWNPAGLAAGESNSAAAAHHIWVGTYRTYSLAGQLKVAEGLVAGAFVLAGDIGLSNSVGFGSSVGEGVQSIVAGVAIGRRFRQFRIGGAVKYIAERVIVTPARGFAVDVGVQASAKNESVRIGASLLNLGQMSDVSAVVTEVPTTLRVGIAIFPFRVISFDDAGDLLNAHLAVDVSRIYPDERTRVHIGAAAQVLEMLTARVGYITNDELRSFTAGLGLDVSPIRFDYALVPFSQGFGGPGHQLSMIYVW